MNQRSTGRRYLPTVLILAISLLASALFFGGTSARADAAKADAIIDQSKLTHKWQKSTCNEVDCFLQSAYVPPVPFSLSVKHEALLSLNVCKETQKRPRKMANILRDEIKTFRKGMKIVDYLETDNVPVKNNVGSWIEEMNGQEVGFIKFRMIPVEGALPATLVQGIVSNKDAKYCIAAIIFFAGHANEVFEDQRRIMNKLTTQTAN